MFKFKRGKKGKESLSTDDESSSTTTTKSLGLTESSSIFRPRCCRRLSSLIIANDGDVWVERYYYTMTARKVFYYMDAETHECQLLDAPTGASVIVRRDELMALKSQLPLSVQETALKHMSTRDLVSIPRPPNDPRQYKSKK